VAISNQARDTWKRFASWYGADALERKFGLTCPPDWAEAIDGLDRNTLARVMAETKQKFPTWMPGLPEFEALIASLRRPAGPEVPPMHEQLCDFVIKHRKLTGEQLRQPWTYLYRGNVRTGVDFAVTGVVVPADGEHPGYRIMVEDMRLETA